MKGDPKFDFIRRQTLKTGERYITPYLEELQHKILSAQFQLKTKEQVQLSLAKEKIIAAVKSLTKLADGIAWLDVYVTHALFVVEKKWIRPKLITDGGLQITAGRHPVIEEYLPIDQQFIANDLSIGIQNSEFKIQNKEESTLHIIT